MENTGRKNNSRVFGLTGGIACGKSLVTGMLQAAGWDTLDTDSLAHRFLEPGRKTRRSVVAEFGENIINEHGQVDRGRLGAMVFAKPAMRLRLEAIVHPPVRRYAACWVSARRREKTCACMAVPLLYEVNFHPGWDAVICVASDENHVRERLGDRSLSAEQIDQRLEAQWPLEEKIRRADHVIFNNGSIEDLQTNVENLIKRIQEGN